MTPVDQITDTDFKKTPLEKALFQITECAVTTTSIEEYSKELHSIIKQLMYAKNFFVALYEQDQSLVNFVYIVDEYDTSISKEINTLSVEELRRTLTGYMLRTGKIQHLSKADVKRLGEKNVIDHVGTDSYDWLGVPLKYKDEVMGGMVIQSYREDISYGKHEEAILQFVARQIALVLKSKQSERALLDANLVLEQRVIERTQDLKRINSALSKEVKERKKSQEIQAALFQISELVSTTESLREFYHSVHQVIKRLMYAENEYIAILNEDGNKIDFAYFVDQHDEQPGPRDFSGNPNSGGFTEKVLATGNTFLYHRNDDYYGVVGSERCVSWLGVPLKDKHRVFGILAVQSYVDDVVYTRDDQVVLLTIGQQVANAILRKKDSDSLIQAHESLERRVKERTFELEKTIEKRKIVEKRLEFESLHDALTGLPNRLHLSNTLNELLQLEPSERKNPLALLFLDLDRFKIINDSLGHHVGDLFLIEVAKRLKSCLRSDDMVARLGGDEFCVLMPVMDDKNAAFKLSTRILAELKKPVEVANHSLITSASIGVRLAESHETSAETIMSDADAAMYQAKHQGKNRFCYFDANIKKLVTSRMKMERDLRQAVSEKQLFLVYQPIVNIRTNQIDGLEALVRWEHPENGLVSPAEFIPVAEETGLIVEIGEEVIRMACEALAEFKQESILKHLYVNVNVSSLQVLARTLDDHIRQNLLQMGLDSSSLNIEITESILIEDYKAAMSFVRELKSMGVQVYLDDFGTGYSSLSYLHKFPFDAIKLDRSFINALGESGQNRAIVESIGQLAHSLGINIVAEGLETKEQLEVIEQMNYDLIQGFYFAKPMKIQEVKAFVSQFEIDD
ncbi:EAL domain-containing protein [Aliikangiella marina]|uniref:EAL domain-containing protein n=1 Tax=Aliikangiella marina TaxID=1712262 RepID=A0A545T728_9GAMM|nr:EAL domain-containing protein [Aliikangiella marina]TQV73034.1 EAL domain-containing protein [Aliikangiella marina]